MEAESEIWRALVLGTRDYARKCGFARVVIGLSGGIDSALTAAIAVEALGAKHVLGVLMPSPYSSRGSVDDSLELARTLGIETMTLAIHDAMDAMEKTLDPSVRRGATWRRRRKHPSAHPRQPSYGAFEQTLGSAADDRQQIGARRWLYTLYGDMSGGLGVIADVPKTMVYRIARWLNQTRGCPVIPEAILTKAPSAELRPNQTDQDSLPPYDILDEILQLHIERHQPAAEIVAAGFDPPTVRRVLGLVRAAEFKRKQAAPGLKVTDRAFGTGWRMPIAAKLDD